MLADTDSMTKDLFNDPLIDRIWHRVEEERPNMLALGLNNFDKMHIS